MHEKMVENCTDGAVQPTAEQIVNDILGWDKPQNHLNNLREMMDSFYLCSEVLTEENKMEVYCTYKCLSNALKKMETLELKKG